MIKLKYDKYDFLRNHFHRSIIHLRKNTCNNIIKFSRDRTFSIEFFSNRSAMLPNKKKIFYISLKAKDQRDHFNIVTRAFYVTQYFMMDRSMMFELFRARNIRVNV